MSRMEALILAMVLAQGVSDDTIVIGMEKPVGVFPSLLMKYPSWPTRRH